MKKKIGEKYFLFPRVHFCFLLNNFISAIFNVIPTTKETDIWLQIAVTSFWSNRESAYNQILPFNSIITLPFWPFISAEELKEIFVTSFTEYFHAWTSVCDDNIKVRKEIKNWELQKSEGNLLPVMIAFAQWCGAKYGFCCASSDKKIFWEKSKSFFYAKMNIFISILEGYIVWRIKGLKMCTIGCRSGSLQAQSLQVPYHNVLNLSRTKREVVRYSLVDIDSRVKNT